MPGQGLPVVWERFSSNQGLQNQCRRGPTLQKCQERVSTRSLLWLAVLFALTTEDIAATLKKPGQVTAREIAAGPHTLGQRRHIRNPQNTAAPQLRRHYALRVGCGLPALSRYCINKTQQMHDERYWGLSF